jgi:hypothetical protein
MLITKVRPSIYMSSWMAVWAIVSGRAHLTIYVEIKVNIDIGCTALVQSYPGLVICRFLLGITEAPVSPPHPPKSYDKWMKSNDLSSTQEQFTSCLYFTLEKVHSVRSAYKLSTNTGNRTCLPHCHPLSCPNQRHRIFLSHCCRCICRTWWGTWFVRMALVSFITSLGSLCHLAVTDNVSLFRLFMLEGVATFFVAILGIWLLPDTPSTTRWLSQRERDLAHARMQRDNIADTGAEVSSMEGLKQACKDYKTWVFVLMQCFHLSACSFNSFFPT